MDAKTKEEIELLQELIDSPDTPQDEKELYRDTIKELKAEAEKAEKSKPEPKVEKKPETKKEEPKAKAEKKPATPKPSATKKEAPKKLPVDADKMKAEIKDRTGKTEEECEEIIAEYRKLREKSKKIEAKRLGKLDDEGKLIDGTKEKTAAAVIETAAENIKDKLEKQVDKMEKDAEKGNPTPDQIEARINKNLGQLSKEMTKQATGFIKGIQAELGKADKTEAKQFLMNVRAEIDELLSKFAGGGAVEKFEGKDIKIEIDKVVVDFEFGMEDKFKIKNNDISGKMIDNKNLISFLSENLNTSKNKEDYAILDGTIYTTIQLNKEGKLASLKEIEDWNNDKIELFFVYYNIIVNIPANENNLSNLTGIKKLDEEYARGGWLRDRRQVNQSEDYETRYEKKNNTGRTSYAKKKNSVASIFAKGGGVSDKISFDKAELETLTDDYSNLFLYSKNKLVYKGTLPKKEANDFHDKHKGITSVKYSGGGGVETKPVYEEGVMISIPQYEKFDDGWFTNEGYAIYNKFADNWNAFFGIAKNLKITKKDALKKANAYYDYMKSVKTEKEYNKKHEEFMQNWKKQFGVGGGVDAGFVQTYNITQGNMSSSSVNPSQFGEGGDIPPFEGERFSQEEFDYRLNLAKSQIISDIMDGTVDPSKINDFGDLGAFVDHNYYGGFIEDDYDHSEDFVFEMKVQDALANWIEEGGINKALENPEMFAVGNKKRFDVDFYESSDSKNTHTEIIIRSNSLENAIKEAIKKANEIKTNYIEFYHKGMFLGSVNFSNSDKFVKGRYYNDFVNNKFAVGGSVEDQISYADARINNLKELRSVSNEDMRENIDFQIEAIEKQKSKLLSGELVPRKKLFGLF